MNADDLEAIKARAAAATEGPWEIVAADDGQFYGQAPTFDVLQSGDGRAEPVAWGGTLEDGGPRIGACGQPDAEFIAAARADVPALVAEVEGWKDVAAEWERAFHNERREADRPCACCARNHAPVGPPRRTRIYHAPTGGTGVCPRCGVSVASDMRGNTWVSADESRWNCTDAD